MLEKIEKIEHLIEVLHHELNTPLCILEADTKNMSEFQKEALKIIRNILESLKQYKSPRKNK